eukprot:Skav224142  [mRNA]  locus=scaffold462:234945:240897:- [translate_table: standard]
MSGRPMVERSNTTGLGRREPRVPRSEEVVRQLKELKTQLAQLKTQLEEALQEQQRLEAKAADAEPHLESLRTSWNGKAVHQISRVYLMYPSSPCDYWASAGDIELQGLVERLKSEKQQLVQKVAAQEQQHEEMKRSLCAMQMHQQHSTQLEVLRAAKLAEAINQKAILVELHIAVPKVTLTYNNAPPLPLGLCFTPSQHSRLISVAAALGEDRLQNFLDKEVFPHFDPLWARLDGLDRAPDGSSKKAYASRMLDRLTQACRGPGAAQLVHRMYRQGVTCWQRATSYGGWRPWHLTPVKNEISWHLEERNIVDGWICYRHVGICRSILQQRNCKWLNSIKIKWLWDCGGPFPKQRLSQSLLICFEFL